MRLRGHGHLLTSHAPVCHARPTIPRTAVSTCANSRANVTSVRVERTNVTLAPVQLQGFMIVRAKPSEDGGFGLTIMNRCRGAFREREVRALYSRERDVRAERVPCAHRANGNLGHSIRANVTFVRNGAGGFFPRVG